MKRLLAGAAVAAMLTLIAGPIAAEDSAMVAGPTWPAIAGDVLGDVTPADGAALLAVDAPYRAEDAATVPVVIRQTDAGPTITGLKLVVDENPSPLVADFSFGPAMHPLKLEMRVRVNQYSNLRVIAATPGGSFMTGRFVKASGGCSAPATKDPAQALSAMGEMRLKVFAAAAEGSQAAQQSVPWREAQIMIRHPNYSGLQRDQITQLFIPAHFISRLEVWQGDEMLFTMDGGISVSENPVFRFDYADNGTPSLRVHAVDTEGNVFDQILPKAPPA